MYSVILLFITMPIVICDDKFLCNDVDVVKNRISYLIYPKFMTYGSI